MPLLAVFQLGHPALAWLAAVAFATLAAHGRIALTGRGWIPAAIGIAIASLALIGGGEIGHTLLLLVGLVAAGWLAYETYPARSTAGLSSQSRRAALIARIAFLVAILLLASRPSGQWSIIDWRRPLLVVLLDQSRSMAIVDPDAGAATQPTSTRADTANALLRRADLARLERFYELRVRAIGEEPRQLSRFQISPEDPATSLEAAIRVAAQLRSEFGEPPRNVILVSDGGENLADSQRVRQAALELAASKAGLLAFGVGPARGGAVLSIDPLQLPARIGTRERLLVPVTLRSAACRDACIGVQLAWNDTIAGAETVTPKSDPAVSSAEFSVTPPGPGVHRLTVSAMLPEDRGGGVVSRSALVEVRDDRIRVLLVDDQFRSEGAFIARALRTDPAFVVEQRILMPPDSPLSGGDTLDDASAFDVILVRDLMRCRRPGDAYDRIAAAVVERGSGLFFIGGAETMNSAAPTRSMLLDFLPTRADRTTAPPPTLAQLTPTERGLAHPVFTSTLGTAAALAEWRATPPVACEPLPEVLKPLVEVLAVDETGRPLLIAAEVGRGRVLQSALRETWPWALASDAGLELHRRTWRQIVRWLANRRPQAWVLCDQPVYLLSAIRSGRERVRVRAGVTGLGDPELIDSRTARLVLVSESSAPATASAPATGTALAPLVIPLAPRDGEWEAVLPGSTGVSLGPGRYSLTFTVARRPASTGGIPTSRATPDEALQATTVFDVASIDRELEPPTHNLGLLREAADVTRTFGGRYSSIDALPAAVDELSKHDLRQRVETTVNYDFARRQAWLLFALAVAAAAVEWSLRRSAGLR